MEGDRLNFQYLLAMGFRYWYLFVILLILSLISAYYYLQFTAPIYSATSMILIKDDEKSGQLDEEAIFSELGLSLSQRNKNLENEQLVLRSTPVLEEVAENLQLQYKFESISQFGRRHLYQKSPIQVVNWAPKEASSNLFATLSFDDAGGYQLILENEPENGVPYPVTEFQGKFGKALNLPVGDLTLARRMEYNLDMSIYLSIIPIRAIAKNLNERLNSSIVGEESSVLQLSINDQASQRAKNILTELFTVYNRISVDEKNQVFKNTIDLINERIQRISQELEQTEQNVQDLKRRFNMVDMSAEGSLLLTEVSALNKEISNNDVQLEILKSIEDFLIRNKENFEFVPTNLSLNNLTLTRQLETFNTYLATRETQRNRLGPSHKDLILTENQISNLRQTIIDNIRSIQGDLQIARNATEERRSGMETRLQSLPIRERELIEIERDKAIQESLYLYLLQKREESYISLAITTPNAKMVEPARSNPRPVSPNPRQIWMIAGFLGLLIPAGIVALLELLNDKINSEEDIQRLTNVPINGAISVSRKKDSLVVLENRKTAIAEMFRLLRANLAYIAPGIQLKTLLITSSTSGEGKSFTALNLGMSQALAGKKVVLIDLDLRKPSQDKQVNENLKVDSKDGYGVVNFLVDHALLVKQIIKGSGIHENLDIISAGPVPPNPSELVLSQRLRDLVESLQEEYDFIIVDSPPVGLVADALPDERFCGRHHVRYPGRIHPESSNQDHQRYCGKRQASAPFHRHQCPADHQRQLLRWLWQCLWHERRRKLLPKGNLIFRDSFWNPPLLFFGG